MLNRSKLFWRGISAKENSGFVAALQTFGANAAVLALNFATGVLTARLLGPSGRGALTALIVWPQLLAFSASIGLPQAIIYCIRREPRASSGLLGRAITLSALAGIVVMIIGMCSASTLLGNHEPSTMLFVRWSMIICPMITVSAVTLASLQAAGKFGLSNINSILAPISTLTLLFIFVLKTGALSPFAAAFCYLLPTVVVFGFCLYFSIRTFGFEFGGDHNRPLVSYGVRVWGIDLLSTLARQVDKAVLVPLLSPAALGAYVVAQSLTQSLSIAPVSIGTVFFPKVAGRQLSEVVEISGLAIRGTTALVGLGAVALSLCAPQLLATLYGEGFRSATTPLRILACEAVLGAFAGLASQVFMAVGKPGTVAVLQAVGVAIFIPAAYKLIPTMGVNGAAIAWLLSSFVRAIMMVFCFPLILGIRCPSPIISIQDGVELWARIRRTI
jgi:enterobacterial common antigen flippase